jgi:ABC-type sugar transport system permease subunit
MNSASGALAPRKRRTLNRKSKKFLFVFFMLLFPTVQFILFWIIPNANSLALAFQLPTGSGEGASWANFTRFWDQLTEPNSSLLYSIIDTLVYFVVTTLFNLPIVTFLSYVLFKKVPWSQAFRVIFYLPAILGGTVTAAMYRYMLGTGGPVEQVLTLLHIPFNAQLGLLGNPDTAFAMVLVYCLWTGVGLNMIMINGAMKRIPEEIFDSAKVDGVGFFREFFQIVVPLIWPTLTTLLVLSMSGLFCTYMPIMLLTPNENKSSLIGWYIVRYTLAVGDTSTNEVYNYPAAVGLIFTLIGLPMTLAVKALCERVFKDVEY